MHDVLAEPKVKSFHSVSAGFHIYHKITIWIPESCLLISIGLVVGGIMHAVKEEPPAVLNSNVFFLYMLPPIVLDNGYFMPTRPFFENVGTVLWYAVVGTLWNSIGIGLSLFAICQFEVFGVQDINLQVREGHRAEGQGAGGGKLIKTVTEEESVKGQRSSVHKTV